MIPAFMAKIFGPNWKTSVTGVGSAVMTTLTLLAMMPQDSGLQFIPEPYRTYLIKAGIFSAFVLRVLNALSTKDANPTHIPSDPAPTTPPAEPPKDDKKL